MIRWTGLAPWEFESLFSGSPTSTFLVLRQTLTIQQTFTLWRRLGTPATNKAIVNLMANDRSVLCVYLRANGNLWRRLGDAPQYPCKAQCRISVEYLGVMKKRNKERLGDGEGGGWVD